METYAVENVDDFSSSTLEKKVLACFLMDDSARQEIIVALNARDFLDQLNRHLYNLLLSFYQQHHYLDVQTFVDFLKQANLADQNALVDLVYDLEIAFPVIDNLGAYLKILRNKSTQHQVTLLLNEYLSEEPNYLDSNQALDQLQADFKNIIDQRATDDLTLISKFTNEFTNRLENIKNNKGQITGTPSGFENIDKITNGFQPGELIILAARPSIGKTALALNMVANIANLDLEKDEAIVVFSLEMGSDQLLERWICSQGMVNIKKFKKGEWSENDELAIQIVNEKISHWPLYLFDGSNIDINQIELKLRQLAKKVKLKLVVIDYLQLIDSSNNKNMNRNQEVAKISRTLKILAKELKVPILAIAQLSRSIEQRQLEDRKPKLSDLRESGAIEQDADIVAFLDYDRTEIDESESNKNNTKFKTNVIVEFTIAKNRSGETGIVKLNFDKAIGKYTDFKEEHHDY